MAAPLVTRANGDVIDASDHNDIMPYIEDAEYRVNTLALEVGSTEVVSSVRAVSNVTGNISLWTNDSAYLTSVSGQSHTDLNDVGTNTHAQIDTHVSSSAIHYTQANISVPASQISDFDTEVSNNTNVASNTTHRTSNGADHTFIDQDVGSTSSPTFTNIGIGTQSSSSYPFRAKGDHVRFDSSSSTSYDTWLEYDMGDDWQYGVTITSGGYADAGIVRWNTSLQMANDMNFRFGDGADYRLFYDSTGKDLTIHVAGGSTDSGLVSIKNATGANRQPSGSLIPKLRVYGNGSSYADEYIDTYYTEAEGGHIESGREDLILSTLSGDVIVNDDLDVTGNITTDGTVDGIDIATDVGANTSKISADVSINTHDNVDIVSDPVAKNDVLMYNGTSFVPVAEGSTFTYSISSFADNQSSSQLIGSGTWLAIGGISFTATYANGPTTSGTVQITSGVTAWSSALDMTSPYTGPTVSTEAVSYPASAGTTIRFRLTSSDGTSGDTSDVTVVFYNLLNYGTTTKTDTYLEADIEGLATQELSNDNTQTWDSITTGSGEYMLFAFPTRLGTPAFWVGGFEGGFESPETVSVTNSAGFTEDYYVWRSTNSNLGSSSVETK